MTGKSAGCVARGGAAPPHLYPPPSSHPASHHPTARNMHHSLDSAHIRVDAAGSGRGLMAVSPRRFTWRRCCGVREDDLGLGVFVMRRHASTRNLKRRKVVHNTKAAFVAKEDVDRVASAPCGSSARGKDENVL
ncbi:hypothetical protein EYF80_045622 [Liparis tanakae]|uniref:Uncharacterized protein n=1 Tax=Liparis tanakae TaxID=230148 RepID=A0A4Z2FSG8_9TELE|nr:hypothetical protein EYF80_045622 [Liparis tanakae]